MSDEVVLLCCFPLTKVAFEFHWINRAEYDYVNSQYDAIGVGNFESLWSSYSNLAKDLSSILADISKLGVEVREDATVEDLVAALKESRTVILLAHWRHESFFEHHILNEKAIREALQSLVEAKTVDEKLIVTKLKECLSTAEWLWQSDDIRDLIDGLDELVMTIAQSNWLEFSNTQTASISRANARRFLDSYLQTNIRPGNRLEMFDGMLDPQDLLLSHRDNNNPLFMDLLVCRSYYLANILKKGLGPYSNFAAGNLPVQILPRAELVKMTRKFGNQYGLKYWDACLELRYAISD